LGHPAGAWASPALGPFKEAVVKADSFRSHAKHLQAANQRIAVGEGKSSIKKKNT
jgi:hypothetical protein